MLHPTIFIIDKNGVSANETANAITSTGYYKSYAISKNGYDAINYLKGLDGHDHFPHVFFIDAETMELEGHYFLKEFEKVFPEYSEVVRIFILKDMAFAGKSHAITEHLQIEGEFTKPFRSEIYYDFVKGFSYVE